MESHTTKTMSDVEEFRHSIDEIQTSCTTPEKPLQLIEALPPADCRHLG